MASGDGAAVGMGDTKRDTVSGKRMAGEDAQRVGHTQLCGTQYCVVL